MTLDLGRPTVGVCETGVELDRNPTTST